MLLIRIPLTVVFNPIIFSKLVVFSIPIAGIAERQNLLYSCIRINKKTQYIMRHCGAMNEAVEKGLCDT